MTDRERLIELLDKTFDEQFGQRMVLTAEHTADYLLKNGVIVPPQPKPTTDLKGKCGSCIYAKPNYECFGGSSCYVDCTNVEHIGNWCKRDISITRQRTHKACKLYQAKECEPDA